MFSPFYARYELFTRCTCTGFKHELALSGRIQFGLQLQWRLPTEYVISKSVFIFLEHQQYLTRFFYLLVILNIKHEYIFQASSLITKLWDEPFRSYNLGWFLYQVKSYKTHVALAIYRWRVTTRNFMSTKWMGYYVCWNMSR